MKNINSNNLKLKILSFTLLFLVFSFTFYASPVQAADPGLQEILLSLDTQKQNVNAVAGELIIPDNFAPGAIIDGDSVLKFWIEKPHFVGQRLIFSGIIPGGYIGRDAKLFKFFLTGEPVTPADLKITNLNLLLNDGLGTKAETSPASIRITIAAGPEALESDTIPPESFGPVIGSDPTIFSGQFFIVFAAQDKQSGIDHYEVSEGSVDNYIRAESPYRLLDQSRRSSIAVRAIDRAGNIRTATVILRPWYITWADGGILIIVSVFILWFIGFIVRKLRERSSRSSF